MQPIVRIALVAFLLAAVLSDTPVVISQPSSLGEATPLDRYGQIAQYVPNLIDEIPDQNQTYIGWVDLEGYRSSGLTSYDGANAEVNTSHQLAKSNTYGLCVDFPSSTWKEAFGVECDKVEMGMNIGMLDNGVRAYQGTFDNAQIATTLESGGYEKQTIGDSEVFFNPIDAFEDESPAATLLIGQAKYFFLVSDSVLVIASNTDMAERVSQTIDGTHPSLAEIEWLNATLAAARSDTNAFVALPKSWGMGNPAPSISGLDPTLIELVEARSGNAQQGEVGPQWDWLLLVRGGLVPTEDRISNFADIQQHESLIFWAEDPGAAQGLTEFVPAQIESQNSLTERQPFTADMRVTGTRTDGNVAVIDLAIAGPTSARLVDYMRANDIGFIIVFVVSD